MNKNDLAQIERSLCEIENCLELLRIDIKTWKDTPRSKTFKFVMKTHIENLYYTYLHAAKIIHE